MVTVNGRDFSWEPSQGLDPQVALEVEGFIRKKAWGFSAWARIAGLDFEDLVQEGWAGALKAASHFNPDAGAKYLTYACPWIESAMKDALNQRTVRTPKGVSRVSVCSLDATLGSGDDQGEHCLLDFQVDDQPSAQELIASSEERARLRAVLPMLTSKERRLIVAHLGLDGRAPQTMPAVAKSLGLSRQGAAQVMEGALEKLRLELAG
jgi:RNA polymerase primary sigma factor